MITRTVRARMLSSHLPLLTYLSTQEKVSDTALKSPSMTPALTALLTKWTQSTAQASSFFQQEIALKQQLTEIVASRIAATEQAHFDEIGYVAGVESVALNKAEVIHSLGLDTATPTTGRPAVGAPSPPVTVTLKPGTDPGGLHISWPRSLKTHTYQVQVSPEPPTATSWQTFPPQGKRTLRVGDLVPGAAYQARVQSTGSGGASVWSVAGRGLAR